MTVAWLPVSPLQLQSRTYPHRPTAHRSFQKEERASALSAADPMIDLLGLCLRIEVVDFDAQVFLKLT